MSNLDLLTGLLRPLLDVGIVLELVWHEKYGYGFNIEGFYKSGKVSIYCNDVPDEHQYIVFSRYDQTDYIDNFKDLVIINYEWWLKSHDRHDGWAKPDSKWIQFLINESLIKQIQDIKYEPAS